MESLTTFGDMILIIMINVIILVVLGILFIIFKEFNNIGKYHQITEKRIATVNYSTYSGVRRQSLNL